VAGRAAAAAGLERTGEVEQTSLGPWATVLRAPTAGGPVWLKAAGPGTAFEVALYGLLVRTVPDHVLTPIAAHPARCWLLLPNGGPTLGERKAGTDLVDALTRAVGQYGRLQRELEPHVDELLDLGLGDMRPAGGDDGRDGGLGVRAPGCLAGAAEHRSQRPAPPEHPRRRRR
jgi:hypothetical protein